MPKTKQKTLTWYKKKAWDAFSIYIRQRDWKEQGEMYQDDRKVARCVTCRKIYPVEGRGTMQAGHFIPGRKNIYLFDERQVNAQCYNCNVNLKGDFPTYQEVMIRMYGQTEVNKMLDGRKQTRKYTIPEFEDIEIHFKELAKDLNIN